MVINLNVQGKFPVQIIHYVQYSTEIPLQFYIADYTLTEEMTARIYIRKPSGKEIYNDCTIDGQTVSVIPTAQMFAEAGKQMGQLQIINGGSILVSFLLKFDVEENIISESAIPSSNEYTALDNLIIEAQQAISESESATQSATSAAQSANSAARSANSAARSANSAAESANSATSDAQSATQNATTAARSATTATQSANNAASAATNAAQSANQAAAAAEAAIADSGIIYAYGSTNWVTDGSAPFLTATRKIGKIVNITLDFTARVNISSGSEDAAKLVMYNITASFKPKDIWYFPVTTFQGKNVILKLVEDGSNGLAIRVFGETINTGDRIATTITYMAE